MRKIAALMLVAMAVAAPLRAQTAAGGMGIMAPNLPSYFDESYNRQTVAVQIGSVVEIRLPENPTTGFMWMVDNLNADKLQLLSNEFVPAGDTHSPGGMVGAGGTRVFKVKCVKMGAGRRGPRAAPFFAPRNNSVPAPFFPAGAQRRSFA
ncbi:MAG: protease inhibitor I42 family protein [Elusimicrobia bacterium]|nr:protease inhibitor I42 family protein [Elusimicrobiota bacterium]